MTMTMRVARPSDNLAPLIAFYCDGLGFEVLYSFADHDGFDGVMIGHKGWPYHLEFTHHRGHTVGRAPTPDNVLVLYIRADAEWQAAVNRMQQHGFGSVPSYNPYWDAHGKTFEDADGYRVVLQNASWDP